ncbi:nuclease-related domain-containing protein [Metabacillus idriensis]|uniref:nuclease-related domain-containing protein n=1 Tax=Metabacillus idriensis TaxID=324768 RepID=UPI003D29BBE5
MIKKELKVSIKIQKLQALLRRLPLHHLMRTKIEEEYAKSMAGYRGELSMDYHLRPLFNKEFLVLHDIRLLSEQYFQMDIIILTKRYVLILEVKNMSGTLCFDQTFKQLIRTINGREEAFPDPIIQVRRQQKSLRKWLSDYNFPELPIHSFIVISNPTAILKTIPAYSETVLKKVIHAASLQEKIESLAFRYKDDLITVKDLNKLSRLLIKHHTPYDPDLLNQFQLNRSELIMGVHCTQCSAVPMMKISGSWVCRKCMFTAKEAYLESLNDYALLLGPTITNKEMRQFLKISSLSSASKLLSALDLPYTGTFKNRKYHLPSLN